MGDFDPKKHIISLQGRPYLQTNARVAWFRSEHPRGCIGTELISTDPVVVKATIYDSEGAVLASDYAGAKAKANAVWAGREVEKASTAAVGRALALAGFGTLYALEIGDDDSDHLADSPVGDNGAANGFKNNYGGDRRAVNGKPQKPEPAQELSATLWEQLKDSDLFKARTHFGNALKHYLDPADPEVLFGENVNLFEAEAAIRLHRSRQGKAESLPFANVGSREKFVALCGQLEADEKAILTALRTVADYEMAGIEGWRGDKLTAWAAVIAFSAQYTPERYNLDDVPEAVLPVVADIAGRIAADMTEAEVADAQFAAI